jgi:hypothetical protein
MERARGQLKDVEVLLDRDEGKEEKVRLVLL